MQIKSQPQAPTTSSLIVHPPALARRLHLNIKTSPLNKNEGSINQAMGAQENANGGGGLSCLLKNNQLSSSGFNTGRTPHGSQPRLTETSPKPVLIEMGINQGFVWGDGVAKGVQ